MSSVKMIWVESVAGRRMPREDNPRRYISGKASVPNRAYYRRAIRRGDLMASSAPKAVRKPRAEEK